MLRASLNAALSLLLLTGLALAQPKGTQQGLLRQELPLNGYDFGASLSLSADGNTALIGHIGRNNGRGAAHVFTRSGATWSRQAILTAVDSLLTGPGQLLTWLGSSVSLSDDGNTALVCAPGDANYPGTAWVFTRQQGSWRRTARLRPNDPNLFKFGQAGAISGDGTTLVVASYFYNSGKGAAWVYTRSGDQWQERARLTASDYAGWQSFMGQSVSISQNGRIIALGAPLDGAFVGATWLFERGDITWVQRAKLVGTNYVGAAYQGQSVGLSSDGSALIVGATYNNNFPNPGPKGASWIFQRQGATWTQAVGPLVGEGTVGAAYQGEAVAMSGDGRLAAVGGFFDDSTRGATWLFTRQHDQPSVALSQNGWQQWGSKLVGTDAASISARQGQRIALSRDGSTLITSGVTDYANNSVQGTVWAFAITQGTTSVEIADASDTRLEHFPNPVRAGDKAWIRNPAVGVRSQVELVDLTGRAVHGFQVTCDQPWIEWTAPALSPGLYLVQVVAAGRRHTGRVLVR